MVCWVFRNTWGKFRCCLLVIEFPSLPFSLLIVCPSWCVSSPLGLPNVSVSVCFFPCFLAHLPASRFVSSQTCHSVGLPFFLNVYLPPSLSPVLSLCSRHSICLLVVYLFAWLSACQSVYRVVYRCLSLHLSICLCLCLFACLPGSLHVFLPACLSPCFSACLPASMISACLPASLHVFCLPACL